MAENNEVSNMELVFDVISESIEIMFEEFKEDYFTLYSYTVKNILESDILQDDLSDESKDKLIACYKKLEGKDISTEDIRKAIQSLMLRGLQETKNNNGNITPDTIGILFAYFISKFEPKEGNVKILDPLAGFGNLLFTLENHLTLNTELYAIEHKEALVNLMKLNSNLLSTNLNIYFSNTFDVKITGMDYVVCDFDYYDIVLDRYFPYDVIIYHMQSLKDGGVFLTTIPSDFFNYDSNQNFKKKLMETGTIIGLIELPDELFKGEKKSILIIKKEVLTDKKCLMVKLPSFNEPKEFNNTLIRIEKWFEENINQK